MMKNKSEKKLDLVGKIYDNYKLDILSRRELQKIEAKKMREKGMKIKLMRIELLDPEKFFNKIKTDPDFSRVHGATIEMRDLSLLERANFFNSKMSENGIRTRIATVGVDENYLKRCLSETKHHIPIKIIKVTAYNGQTQEIYE